MKTLQFKRTIMTIGAWANLITRMKCPACDKPIMIYSIGGSKYHVCPACGLSYHPPKPKKVGVPKERSLIDREISARKSGVSVLERLVLYYYCDKCEEWDKKKREAANKELKAEGKPELEDIGNDGLVERSIPNLIHIFKDGNPLIPFNCKCGTRYNFLSQIVKQDSYTRYRVEKGYHGTCFACVWAWNKALDSEFLYFNCDRGIGNCANYMKIEGIKDKFALHVEEETKDEQDNQRSVDQP